MPPEELIIRRARPEDAGQIIAITQRLAQEDGCYVSYTFEEASIDVAKEQARIQRMTDLFIVAEVGRKVVGDLSLSRDSWTLNSHMAYLGMELQSGYRNKGIGTRMMHQAVDWAEKQRIKRIELEVFAENAPAIHLYQKFGFEIEGRKRHAVYKWGRYLDMLVMGLLLPNCQ